MFLCYIARQSRINARGDAPRLLRRRRPPRFAARSIPLGRPARLMAALWDGTDLSWPEERGARPTVVTVLWITLAGARCCRGDADGGQGRDGRAGLAPPGALVGGTDDLYRIRARVAAHGRGVWSGCSWHSRPARTASVSGVVASRSACGPTNRSGRALSEDTALRTHAGRTLQWAWRQLYVV